MLEIAYFKEVRPNMFALQIERKRPSGEQYDIVHNKTITFTETTETGLLITSKSVVN